MLKYAEIDFPEVLYLILHSAKTTAHSAADSPRAKGKRKICLAQATHFVQEPRLSGTFPTSAGTLQRNREFRMTKSDAIRKSSDGELFEVLREGGKGGKS